MLLTFSINDQLVHSSRTKSGSDGISNGTSSIDVAQQLALSLACVSAVFKNNNLRLLE
jgi:hypothetical protein